MTAVDHAELKRLADELVQILAPDQGERAHPAFGLAVRIQSAHAALLSEIEGLKAERDEARRRRDEWRKKAEGYDAVRLALREKVGAPWPAHLSRVLWAGIAADEKSRADEAERQLAALRTQAPDSWRPTEQEVETVLRCCDSMERSVERKGLPKSEADICVATDWLRKVCAALRPQTAESGK